MIEFKNKRVTVKVHQTIKYGDKFGEFFKFELGEEADIADEVDSREARGELFRNLVEESTIREAAIKAIHDKSQLDKIIEWLQKLFRQASAQGAQTVNSQPQAEPPIYYYGPNDLIDDEEEMQKAQVKGADNA